MGLADGARAHRGPRLGNLAGYGVLLVAIALVLWRLDRLCHRLNWTGMREYRAEAPPGRDRPASYLTGLRG